MKPRSQRAPFSPGLCAPLQQSLALIWADICAPVDGLLAPCKGFRQVQCKEQGLKPVAGGTEKECDDRRRGARGRSWAPLHQFKPMDFHRATAKVLLHEVPRGRTTRCGSLWDPAGIFHLRGLRSYTKPKMGQYPHEANTQRMQFCT